MDARKRLKLAFDSALADFLASPPIKRLMRGDLDVRHYKSYLRETYFYTRESPATQAWVSAWFKGDARSIVKPYLKHVLSEVGHDQLALRDLEALGEDTSSLPSAFPLPETAAFTAFSCWSVQFINPCCYLGRIYFLEGMPSTSGDSAMSALGNIGVPPAAMEFISEHAAVDVAHMKLMDRYVESLVLTEKDERDVVYSIKAHAVLFERLLCAAFEAVDSRAPAYGADLGEASRLKFPLAAE